MNAKFPVALENVAGHWYAACWPVIPVGIAVIISQFAEPACVVPVVAAHYPIASN
jgi:hypothetical protein